MHIEDGTTIIRYTCGCVEVKNPETNTIIDFFPCDICEGAYFEDIDDEPTESPDIHRVQDCPT